MLISPLKIKNSAIILLLSLFISFNTGCFFSSNAPSELTVTDVSSDSISLEWTDNSKREHGFTVERSLDEIIFTEIADLPSDTTTFTDTGLETETKYFYRVRAYFKRLKTFYSDTVSATTGKDNNFSTIPDTTLPVGLPMEDLVITESNAEAPPKINFHFVPVGKVYDVSIEGGKIQTSALNLQS